MSSERRDDLVAKIARLYYLEEMNQKEIADKLSISLATISRNLARAREKGIVEIVIHDTRERESSVEILIEKKFGLKECIVTRVFEKRRNVYREMGLVMGNLLSRILVPGDTLGVSWGETLKAIADNLVIDKPADVNVVPIIGAMGQVENGIYPNAIAASFAQKLGGRNFLINTPAVLDSEETRLSIEKDRSFVPVRQWWNRVSTAIVSVSDLSAGASLARYEILSKGELAGLQNLGVVCATNFNFIDLRGNEVESEIDRRMIKMSLDELSGLRNLIVAATGPEKLGAVIAALTGGFVDILVTDQDTADSILETTEKLTV